MNRRGLGKGLGRGYYNLVPKDPYIHSLSAKGVKTKCSMKFVAMDKDDILHDFPERNKLLSPYWNKRFENKWSDGIKYFRLLPLENVKKLVEKGYLELEEQQNESPTTEEFIEFMEKWKKYGVKAHGYAVSKKRDDTRVTIEGLEVYNPVALKDINFVRDWYEFNRTADKLDKNRSWWD